MQKKNIKAVFFGGIILFSFLSCIDSKYDLGKDIDLSLRIGGENLTLPIGSSEKIYLNSFVKIEEDGILDTLDTGEYYLVKEDAVEDIEVDIKPVEISEPTFLIEEISIDPHFFEDLELPNTDGYTTVPIPVNQDGSFKVSNEDMPPEVIRIQSFDIKKEEEQEYYLNISFSAENLGEGEQLDLTGLWIHFPDFFVFKEGQQGLDDENTYKIDNSDGKAFLTKNNLKFEKQLYVDRFEFDETRGWVIPKTNEDGEEKFTFDIDGDVKMGDEIKAIFPGDLSNHTQIITLKTDITFEPSSFSIGSIKGQVNPQIDVETIKMALTGIPDFLTDDDVRMDLANPEVFLHIENPFGLPVYFNLDMQGWKNQEKTHKESVKIERIAIPANLTPDQPPTPTTIVFSRLGAPKNHKPDSDTIYYKEDKLGDLFLVIPDEIELKIEAEVDQEKPHVIFFKDTKQAIKMSYEVNLPLSFGKKLAIVYKDTLSGWNESIKDLDIKRINLEMEILNTIPLELSLSGYAIDVEGKKLDRMIVGIKNDATIPASDGSEVTASITIEIAELIPAYEDTPTAIMKKMDGIVLNIAARSTEDINGIPLNSLQYIMLRGVKAKVPGGVILNMN
ncbi:hypothetical protein EZS27_005842 [termite gut metagenome]|uniref:Uncharacterized protein n=1 Tax=termite gut metagenome TaxID=433724 RepID=A0A5J4SK80_9ZZZZ